MSPYKGIEGGGDRDALGPLVNLFKVAAKNRLIYQNSYA
jgi:hypothetical protein